MADVVVDDVWAEGSKVYSTVSASGACRRFITEEPFFVDFDVDVTDVPEGLLSIPVLSQVCPIAWALGSDVRADTVDRRFLESLREVGSVLCRMYPDFMQGGTVVVGEAVETRTTDDESANVGMLFTGGVDSLTTYIRHREEDPTLVTVQGWVIGIDEHERWEHTRARIEDYGDRFGVETRFVRSNMLSFLDTTMLSIHFADRHDGGWYSAVAGGLGLLGLCAPMTSALDMGRLYIAASHWEDFPASPEYDHWDGAAMPWGSHPAIDDSVAWGSTTAVHDGFDLSRQERIGVIADYVRETGSDLPIRTCTVSETSGNCSACEKCLRTALGLAIEGIDPNRHGYDVDRSTFEAAWEKIEAGEWLADDHHSVYWRDLRRRASDVESFPVEGATEFVDRLHGVDFDEIAGPPARDRVVRTIARQTPYGVYSTLYPVYESIKRRLDGSKSIPAEPVVDRPDPRASEEPTSRTSDEPTSRLPDEPPSGR